MPDKDKIPEAVRALMERTDTMITARDLAPVVRMHPDVIIDYAKTGKWPREICNYIISGNRVKFFREDFLRKAGYLEEEKPEVQVIDLVIEELKQIRQLLVELMEAQK